MKRPISNIDSSDYKEKGRKKRSDRKHAIYQITNKETGDKYVGITFIRGQAIKRSMKLRLKQHWSSAKNAEEGDLRNIILDMKRYETIENYQIELILLVRGKEEAYKVEAEYIRSGEFKLNSSLKVLRTKLTEIQNNLEEMTNE